MEMNISLSLLSSGDRVGHNIYMCVIFLCVISNNVTREDFSQKADFGLNETRG